MRSPAAAVIVAALVAAAVGAVAWLGLRDAGRDEAIQEYLKEGSRLEDGGDFALAIQVYEQALADETALELRPEETAELRYRLAGALIQGNDLSRALGVLQEMIEEDVAAFRIDVTPLLMALGDRAMDSGQRPLARLAYRLGDSVSVTMGRKTDFREKLEVFIEERGVEQPDIGEPDIEERDDGS